MGKADKKYAISLSFQEISLPSVEDILVLGKASTQGKNGLAKTFEYLVPDTFVMVEIDDHPNVEAIFINKRILSKISVDQVQRILADKVYPFTSPQEILKVDFKVVVHYETIEID
ncbi:MAG: hypothetical protein ACFCUI_06590 [Bernardetiaceae bacterium]